MIFRVPAGARVFFGAPAQPMEQALIRSIAEAVATVPGIIEAHLPQCYVPEVMQKPAQVLVLVLSVSCHLETSVAAVAGRLSDVLPTSRYLDLLPIVPNSSLLSTIRGAGCKIFDRSNAVVF